MDIKFKLCLNNQDFKASLEKGKVYRELDDAEARKHNLIRIIDESGEDYLYPSDLFVSVKLPKSAIRSLVA